MPRATNKAELLTASKTQYEKLLALVNSFTPQQQTSTFPFEDRDRNVRDVLIHLYEWHQLLLNFEKDNLQGRSKDFLPDGHNWKTYPQMNVEFWKKHQQTDLAAAKKNVG